MRRSHLPFENWVAFDRPRLSKRLSAQPARNGNSGVSFKSAIRIVLAGPNLSRALSSSISWGISGDFSDNDFSCNPVNYPDFRSIKDAGIQRQQVYSLRADGHLGGKAIPVFPASDFLDEPLAIELAT
jgi:hypothetical protein